MNEQQQRTTGGIPDFEALLADLDAHNGKLTKDGWFYWRFSNGDAVGRKKRRQAKP